MNNLTTPAPSAGRFDRWPLGINPEMDAHAAQQGLSHWSCVSPGTDAWWIRRDGKGAEFTPTGTPQFSIYRERLEHYDKMIAFQNLDHTTIPEADRPTGESSAFGNGPVPFVWEYQPQTHDDPHACRIGDWLLDDHKPISNLREVRVKGEEHRVMYFRLCRIQLPIRTDQNPSPDELWAKLIKIQDFPSEKRKVEHLDQIYMWVRIG